MTPETSHTLQGHRGFPDLLQGMSQLAVASVVAGRTECGPGHRTPSIAFRDMEGARMTAQRVRLRARPPSRNLAAVVLWL